MRSVEVIKNYIKIYLAGKMGGLSIEEMNDWREKFKKSLMEYYLICDNLEPIKVINPVDYYNFEEKLNKNEKEVMQFDLNHVKTSDLIVVNLKDINSSIGTAIELYEAFKRDIPVLSFGTHDEYNQVHPWLKECITRHHSSLYELRNYIIDFYLML